MKGYITLTEHTAPAEVRWHGSIFAGVVIDDVSIQSEDPALLDALGAAFILAATQLGDAIADRDTVLIARDAMAETNRLALLAREIKS